MYNKLKITGEFAEMQMIEDAKDVEFWGEDLKNGIYGRVSLGPFVKENIEASNFELISTVYQHKDIHEAALAALENWDFQVYLDNGESPEEVANRKEALDMSLEYIQDNWEDGIELEKGQDIFDWLEEFSTNMR